MLNPFTPGPTVSRTVTGTTARVQITIAATHGYQLMVTSPAGGAIAFIAFGSATVEAAVTDTPILPGTVQIFTVPASTLYVAAIGTSGTTLYFTSGDGA
jgi:hypothetical protein